MCIATRQEQQHHSSSSWQRLLFHLLDGELLQAFRDSLHLRLHDLAEADKLYWSHAQEAARAVTGHGLVEEDRSLTALAL
jgi:hypothetical protein